VLTEACYGGKNNDTGHNHDYKELFDFPHSAFGQYYGYWGNCVLSKYPILETKTFPLGERTALRSVISVDNKPVTIDTIHYQLSFTEDEKIKAIKPLLESKKGPYILTGDFNSLSDEDNYDRQKLVTGLKGYLKDKTDEEVDRMMERKFIPYLRSSGLHDAFEPSKRTYTLPTDLQNKDKSYAMRLDYFFVSPEIKVKDAYVIKNALTEKASDHYPICGTFEITA